MVDAIFNLLALVAAIGFWCIIGWAIQEDIKK